MKPMRQVLLADGNPADAAPAREALSMGRFRNGRTPVESFPSLTGSCGIRGYSGPQLRKSGAE